MNPAISKLKLDALVGGFKILVEKGEIFNSRSLSCREMFNRGCIDGNFPMIARSLEGNEHPVAVKLQDAIKKYLHPNDDRKESPEEPINSGSILKAGTSDIQGISLQNMSSSSESVQATGKPVEERKEESPSNGSTVQGGNDANKAHGDANRTTAHEGQAPELPEPIAIPGVEYVDLASIEIDPEASSMFERTPAVSDALRQSIKKDGFKIYHPVKAWGGDNGKCTPYDGHTRLEIAAELGITKIPVVKTSFASREAFLEAAINEQVDRRNLSIKDKFSIVKHYAPIETENALGRHGGKSAEKSADSPRGRANAIIGRKIGYGPDIVARMKALIDADNEELLKKVYSDEMSISSAFTILKPRKVKPPDEDKSEDSKIKPGTKSEQKKSVVADEAANANKGAKVPEEPEANSPHGGILTATPTPASTTKEGEDVKLDMKDTKTAKVQISQPENKIPTPPPAVPVNDTIRFLPASERLLGGLLAMVYKDSKQKIYGLMTGCPKETREFIKVYFSSEKSPSKQDRQKHSSPADLTFGKKKGHPVKAKNNLNSKNNRRTP